MVEDQHAADPKSPPNLVFVFFDQQARDMVGAYSVGQALTPHLDALAVEGILFDHAVSNAPVCTPARSMIISGQHPLRNQLLRQRSAVAGRHRPLVRRGAQRLRLPQRLRRKVAPLRGRPRLVLRTLEERGLVDNTIVVHTSDHGETFGASNNHWHKGSPEDVSVRVPLIMRLPGGVGGVHRSQLLIGTLDLMPTLLALMGLPVPEECQGQDLSAAIRDQDHDVVESVPLFSFSTPWRGVYTRRRSWVTITRVRPWSRWRFRVRPIQPSRGICVRGHPPRRSSAAAQHSGAWWR